MLCRHRQTEASLELPRKLQGLGSRLLVIRTTKNVEEDIYQEELSGEAKVNDILNMTVEEAKEIFLS